MKIIIAGAGKIGHSVARILSEEGHDITIIDRDPDIIQLLSNELVNCLIVVVRYFGGTKLGVSGLIGAYKESAAEAIRAAEIVERTVDTVVEVEFSYLAMNDVMRVVKEEQPRVLTQQFDNLCRMTLAIRQSLAGGMIGKLEKIGGVTLEMK